MTKTLTLEGDITTVDTRTAITTQGSVAAPSVVTPAGITKIDKIFVACTADGAAAGSAAFYIRLGGNAVQNGEQVIMASAAGIVAPQQMQSFIYEDVDMACTPDTITVDAEMAGSDLGTAHIVVTLVFA
jgi:succinyl-CoA synthetase beta subunit